MKSTGLRRSTKLLMKHTLLALLITIVSERTMNAEVSENTLRRRLGELRSDAIWHNCQEAFTFLSRHSHEKKVQNALLRELAVTDEQGKESILKLLCEAKGFRPDTHFIKTVMTRMRHYGRPDYNLLFGRHGSPEIYEPAGDAGANFLIRHAHKFGDVIADGIESDFRAKTNSLWFQYALTRALAKGEVIDRYANRYTAKFLRNLSRNLKADKIDGNAQLATATFIFLGSIGEPTLQSAASSSDVQGRMIAKSILAYFSRTLTTAQLCTRLEQWEIAFSCAENPGDIGELDDCDLRKKVIGSPVFAPPEEVVRKWLREVE